jgi:sugar phosphate isomerase/epimerase
MSTSVTRRRFIQLASAAAAGATFFDVPRILGATAPANDDPYGGFPIGAQSYSLREFDTREAVRHIQGLGLHYVEFFSKHLPLDASDARIAETKELLDAAQVSITAHGVTDFTADHEANRRVFEFARRAGIRNITANPRAESFDSLDKLVAEYNIRIAIHNHGPGALYDKVDSVVSAVEKRHKLIGACVDTGHFLRSREDPVKAVLTLGDRVFAVHVKDDIKQGEDSQNVIIGQGHLDVVGLFKALREVKFPADGSLSLEYEANPENPIDDMKQCLEVARKAIAELAG